MNRSHKIMLVFGLLAAGALGWALLCGGWVQIWRAFTPPPRPEPAQTTTALPLAPMPREKPTPCRATFERVKRGMTLEQVIATVGAAPGIYTTAGTTVAAMPRGFSWSDYASWVADDGELLVLFADGAGYPIRPKAVKPQDVVSTVHIWDVMNFSR